MPGERIVYPYRMCPETSLFKYILVKFICVCYTSAMGAVNASMWDVTASMWIVVGSMWAVTALM